MALSVAETALDIDAKLIIAFTESGETARRISKIRPCCPIAAVTSKEDVRLSLQLNWGVHPVVSNQPTNEKDLARTGVMMGSGIGGLDYIQHTKGIFTF